MDQDEGRAGTHWPVSRPAEGRPRARRAAAFSTTVLLAVAADVLSKAWAERTLADPQPVPIIDEMLRLNLGYNTGVAFGVFADGAAVLLLVTGLMIAGLSAWMLVALRRPDPPSLPLWPLGLLLGGAVANFLDRLGDGRVTDFIDAGLGTLRWPAFNLADSAIVIGVGLLLYLSFRESAPAEVPPRD